MLVPDVLVNKFRTPKAFIANIAFVFFTFLNLLALINAKLVLHFIKDFVF